MYQAKHSTHVCSSIPTFLLQNSSTQGAAAVSNLVVVNVSAHSQLQKLYAFFHETCDCSSRS